MTERPEEVSRIPDLLLERYRLGEVTAEETRRVRRRLETDADLRERLRTLDASDAEIARSLPAGWLAERVRRRTGAGTAPPAAADRRVAWRRLAPVAALAIAVFAVGLKLLGPLRPPTSTVITDGGDSGERIKGQRLLLVRKTAGGTEVLGDGAVARAGDLVRIGYRPVGHSYGVILSIDGRGSVTLHLPRQGDRSPELGRGGQVLLDHAYELDDAPNWERFYFLSSTQPFDIPPVVEAARMLAGRPGAAPPGLLVLPASIEQSTLLLLKETKR